MFAKLEKLASWRWVILFALLFLATSILINGRPFGVAALKDITGGVGLLDMKTYYTPDQAYQHLEALGEAGRRFNIRLSISLDYVFPLVYSLLWFSLIALILRAWLGKENPWRRLSLLALAGGLFDWLENTALLGLLFNYPQRLDRLAAAASLFTGAKWALNLLGLVLILTGLIGLGCRRIRRPKQGSY